MLIQIVIYNLLSVLGIGMAGYFPALLLERKTTFQGIVTRLFFSLILGFFIFESLVAIWVAKGLTMQILNLIPFAIIYLLPDNKIIKQPSEEKPLMLLLPMAMLLFSSWYFLRSYSKDLQNIDFYPFIDIVNYASSSFGMFHSGSEVSFADAAVFFPEKGRINLYHFTDLWAATGLSRIFSVTELWTFCFLLPVFLFVLISFGLASNSTKNQRPIYFTLALLIALCFSNSKLLFFSDYFFYNVLDLCGIKISLIIPFFLFLYRLKGHPQAILAFLLMLPQVNILLAVVLAIGVGIYFMIHIKNFRLAFSLPVMLGYFVFGAGFLFLMFIGKGSDAGGPVLLPFSISIATLTFFNYLREAFFNLGFLYWVAFLQLAALLVNRQYIVLVMPFIIAKAVSKLVLHFLPEMSEWSAVPEVLIFFIILYRIDRRFRIIPMALYQGFLLAIGLCFVGAVGYSVTGFMDFEQIYTLFTCSCFFIIAFLIFNHDPDDQGLLSLIKLDRYKWIIGTVILLFITFQTFRFQRVLYFDKSFYSQIKAQIKPISGDKYSAYFSSRRYSPFPLHIKTGFPLMFTWSSAISTPVTMFEDESWLGKNIQWHVEQYPFHKYCLSKTGFDPAKNLEDCKKSFLKEKGIRYLWIDADYDKSRLAFLETAVQKRFSSASDKLEFWLIDPAKL